MIGCCYQCEILCDVADLGGPDIIADLDSTLISISTKVAFASLALLVV